MLSSVKFEKSFIKLGASFLFRTNAIEFLKLRSINFLYVGFVVCDAMPDQCDHSCKEV